jgi:pPIWI_RE module N-terminal domain/RNaseH domain of pPIWI_RE/MID domain of pPIWI_RE
MMRLQKRRDFAVANVDTLQVAVWTAERLPNEIPLVRFALPSKAHDMLAQWFREKTNRSPDSPVNVIVSGLSEVIAFLVPETAYIKVEREGGPNRLSLYFLASDIADRDEIRQRIRASLSLWLGLIYPKREPDLRSEIANTVDDDGNWTTVSVGTAMRNHAGTCANPSDSRLFDALMSLVARRLAGKRIQFATGQERTMVLQTPQSALFGGIELVAFPPTRGREGSDALWSEVITISTATFPERKQEGIHILARPSIRNWGPIHGYDTATNPSRSLDVFMPPVGGDAGFSGYRHATFRFKAAVENWKAVMGLGAKKRIIAKWDSQTEHRVFDLVGRLAGAPRLADADHTHIVIGEEGRWVLPRHAPGSGDRFMAGGSGVGWPDRQDIAKAIDAYLEPAGFSRAVPLTRLKGTMPVKGPFNNVSADGKDQARGLRRAALIRTLKAIGTTSRGLDIIVFRLQEGTPLAIVREISEYFGTPDRTDGACLIWNDGLRINVVPVVSGVLAQALPKLQLTAAEEAGKTDRQQIEIRRTKQEEANRRVAVEMRTHVRAARAGGTEIGCAILEMPSAHLGTGAADPYAVARSELASERLLPQVMLVDDDGDGEENPKIRAAVRDLLRMLGVVPVFEEKLPYAVAAIAAIQRNSQVVGGGTIQAQAFPLAVRTKDGILECAIPQDDGEPTWQPYAEAALFIFSGINERFRRSRTDDNVAKFHTFYSTVLEQINRSGETVVLADMDTLGEKWMSTIQNGKLMFDRIEIGNRVYSPADLGNVRLIRLSATANKLPTYYVDDETQWPTGMFTWGTEAQRTGYALKKKPVSAKTVGRAMPVSRHLPIGDNRAMNNKPRKVSSVDEVCVALCQSGDDLTQLRLFAHRLRSVHAQYDDDTVSPFPLHELLLLGKAVTA